MYICLDKEVKSFTKHTGLKVKIAETQISGIGSEFDVNNMKSGVHPASCQWFRLQVA